MAGGTLELATDHQTASEPEREGAHARADVLREPSPLAQAAREALGDWLAIVGKDPDFCKAGKILKAKVTKTIFSETFSELLPFFACLAVPRKGGNVRKIAEEFWASKTGKTWKALREFPARLRVVADDIERINKSDYLTPTIWLKKDQTLARLVKDHFLRLPGVLRQYAIWLDILVGEKVPGAWRKICPLCHGDILPTFFTCQIW